MAKNKIHRSAKTDDPVLLVGDLQKRAREIKTGGTGFLFPTVHGFVFRL